MKYRHYAPKAPVVLLRGDDDRVLAFLQAEQKNKTCAILCYDEEIPHLNPKNLLPIGKRA
jgi:hypothetical protein